MLQTSGSGHWEMSDRFKINTPDVSAEDFGDEIIAINLKNGHYHSLRGVGAQIWKLLEQGYSVDDASTALRQAFPNGTDTIASDVRDFATELQKADLIVPAAGAGALPAAPTLLRSGESYARPAVESFTDMEKLLLLDPIHEVDLLTGWPRQPDSPAGDGIVAPPDSQDRK